MKKTSLPKLVVMLLLSAISVGMKVQVLVAHESLASDKTKPMPKNKSQINLNKYELIKDEGKQKIYIPKRNNLNRKEAGADIVKVTCEMEYDPTVYNSWDLVHVLNESFYNVFSGFDYETGEIAPPNTVICSVPVGTYDFCTEGKYYNEGTVFVVKEQVNITKDTTIVFKFADAKNKYSVETYKPNGDLCEESIMEYTEDWQKNVIREANINAFNDFYILYLKGIAPLFISTMVSNYYMSGKNPSYTMFINDLSDRYRLMLARSVHADGTWYISKYETENMMSGMTFKNNPNNYLCYEEQFFISPTDEEDGVYKSMGAVVSVDNIEIGEMGGDDGTKAVDGIVKLYVDAPKNNELGQGHIDILPCVGISKQVEQTYVWEDEDEEGNIYQETETFIVPYPIYGLPVVVSKNGIEYVNASHDKGGNYSFHVPEEGDMMAYPGNPAFGYTDKQKLLLFGSGCPINAFMAQNYYNEGFEGLVSNFDLCYIGRYGEMRVRDMVDIKTEVKYNGETICSDYGTHDRDMYNFNMQHNTDGVIDAVFTNENVVVDELSGKNITTVHYNWGADDMTAPTLQMLWFKNQDGNVIDRFDTAENGTLEFAGGDFNFHMLPDHFFFDCKEQTVEVNYSPYNKNEWSVLEVEEIPENFYMPGFGYFYRGSLKDVTGTGEKGWFDLKIRLEDMAGNWQEQVISPAFRIDDLVDTGIENIEHSELSIEHSGAVYDMLGRCMSKNSSTSNKGIRIVRKPNGDVRKVVVR